MGHSTYKVSKTRATFPFTRASRCLLGGACGLVFAAAACNAGDNGGPAEGPTTEPSATTPGVLPGDPGIFEPPAAGAGGKGPNPNTVIDANPMGCGGEGETFPGSELPSCYRFVSVPSLTWAQASIDCTLWSAGRGHLVSITTAVEAEFIRTLTNGASVWLGASDAKSEGAWTWLSGEVWFYANFGTGRPDNRERSEHCLSLTTDGLWDDQPCDLQLPYVCERPFGQ
jgi:hypothetical protein